MASYWIVVPRGNVELFELLSVAFRGRADFSVIIDRRDRRAAEPRSNDSERRGSHVDLGPDDIVIAERAERVEPAERSQADRGDRRTTTRPRRRSPRSPFRTANAQGAPMHPRAASALRGQRLTL